MAGSRRAKSFQCPSCGSPQEIVALGHTKTYACPACSAVIDMSKPEFEVVLKYQEASHKPNIPLGTRGVLHDTLFEVIGYSQKTEGSRQYFWSEYLLFNPYHGFRWLVESNGHWNFGTPIKQQPEVERGGDGRVATFKGENFKEFTRGKAITIFILGEFYWEARSGDEAGVSDFINPPLMLSVERTEGEVNWTLLEYEPAWEVKKIFKVSLPKSGIAPNQPSWVGKQVWKVTAASLVAMLALILGESMLGQLQLNKKIYSGSLEFIANDPNKIRVIPDIQISGRTSNIEIKASSEVNNSWVYLDYDLTNMESGDSYGSSSEISYYSGSDSDGAWTEGSKTSSTIISAVPSGKYSLTVEPELPPGSNATASIAIMRDAPYYTNSGVAFFLLCIPPFIFWIMHASFEAKRWEDSDE